MKNESKTNTLNFIDVFSGAGGLSCGLEQAGMKCLLGVDINPDACKTFALNHKHSRTFCDDITKLRPKLLRELTNNQEIHAVVGGPPCQGFSTAGKGDPSDLRNSLFLQFVRLVKTTKPFFIIIENVTGLLAKKNEKTLKSILSQFTKLGYDLDFQVMSSDKYGVPETRRRTIILGSRINVPINFPEPTHNIKSRSAVTVAKAFKNLKTKKGKLFNHDLDKTSLKSKLDEQRLKHIPEGKGIRYQRDEEEYLPKKLRLKVNWAELRENRFRQTKYLRLDSKRPSPTIMTHRHSYYHPTENRYLTTREAASIQSFPNDFIFEGSVTSQWRQIGNAVPPLLGKALGKTLINMHNLFLKTQKESSSSQSKKSPQPSASIRSVRKGAFVYQKKND